MSKKSLPLKRQHQGWWSLLSSLPIKRILKFGVVGGTGVLVNLGVFQGFLKLTQAITNQPPTGRHIFMAGLCGFLVSVFTNFTLNDLWTWGDRPKTGLSHYFRRLGKYYLASLAGGGIQLATLMLLTTYLSIPALLAQGAGIILGTIINFVLSHFWAFSY